MLPGKPLAKQPANVPGKPAAGSAGKVSGAAAGSSAFIAEGARLTLRRRQRIALDLDAGDHVFCIESGCLTLDVPLVGGRRVVLMILYPGDQISKQAIPPVANISLSAATPAIVRRFNVEDAGGAEDVLYGQVAGGRAEGVVAARQLARAALHSIVIGRLTGEERLATLLIELALKLGQSSAGGISFELPLSRVDMADYLALNPDTLSRLLSRMKARGLLALPTRSRAILKNTDALFALTPLARAVRQLYGLPPAPSQSEQPLGHTGRQRRS